MGRRRRRAAIQRAQEEAEKEAARVAAAQAAAAAAAAAVADEREVQRWSQLPRAVVAFRKPAAIEGLKNPRQMEAATAQVLRSAAAGIYGMVHALRPQPAGQRLAGVPGRTPTCSPRYGHNMGMFDKKGPFPNEV